MGKAHIPFNKVDIQGNEFEYIKDATASSHKSGDGIFSHKCNSLLEKELDENKLEGLITEKTKAIIPVHYAGVGCEMDIIMNIAKMIQKELKDSFDYDCPIEIIKPSTDVTKVDSFIFSIKKIRQLGFSSEIVDKEFLSLLNYCKIKYHK